MNHLQVFEEFGERDIVDYNGNRARILSKDGTKCHIIILRGGTELDVEESELKNIPRCLSRCNKQVIGSGTDRKIYCYGCSRVIKSI